MCSLFSVLLQLQDVGLCEGWKGIDRMGSPCRTPGSCHGCKATNVLTITIATIDVTTVESSLFKTNCTTRVPTQTQ